jgi:glycerol kinase
VGSIARCILESLALTYRASLQTLEQLTGRQIDTLHIVGGGSQSPLLNQFAADATGRTVQAGPVEATAIGNLLIQAYLKDWLVGKEDVAVDAALVLESADGDAVGVEWTISYTAAGRRWNDLPRATFLRLDADGRVVQHRDYA